MYYPASKNVSGRGSDLQLSRRPECDEERLFNIPLPERQ